MWSHQRRHPRLMLFPNMFSRSSASWQSRMDSQRLRGKSSESCLATLLSFALSWKSVIGRLQRGSEWRSLGVRPNLSLQESQPLHLRHPLSMSQSPISGGDSSKEHTWAGATQNFWMIFHLIVMIGWIGVIAYWAQDTAPPFELHNYTVQNAPPGGTIIIRANVTRHLDRKCSVEYSRSLVDYYNIRHPIDQASLTHEGLSDLDRTNPNMLYTPVVVPTGTAIGPARLVVPQRYECNPWHRYFPISVITKFDVEVLPRETGF